MGIIGDKEYTKKIFLENLTKTAIESNLYDDFYEYLIVFKYIPIKIKLYITENLKMLIENFENIQSLDIAIFTLNLYDKNSINSINKQLIKDLFNSFLFQGLSVLVGLDIEQLDNKTPSKRLKISRFKLEKITKDLNLIYCFEVFNKKRDINEIYNTLFNDFILRFQYSNPELFETAKEYGKWLIS
ncbi:MAG: hypothetical protein ACFFDF_13160 [Candidatus Odinarchaeota archaeon]